VKKRGEKAVNCRRKPLEEDYLALREGLGEEWRYSQPKNARSTKGREGGR